MEINIITRSMRKKYNLVIQLKIMKKTTYNREKLEKEMKQRNKKKKKFIKI